MSDPAKYRTKEELAEYKAKDPVEMVRREILDNNIATEKELSTIETKVKEDVAECVKFAEESEYPAPEAAYEDVYSDNSYPFVVD